MNLTQIHKIAEELKAEILKDLADDKSTSKDRTELRGMMLGMRVLMNNIEDLEISKNLQNKGIK